MGRAAGRLAGADARGVGAAPSDRVSGRALRRAAQTHRAGVCRAAQRTAAAGRRGGGRRRCAAAAAGRVQGPRRGGGGADAGAGRALQFGAGRALSHPDQRTCALLFRAGRRTLCPHGRVHPAIGSCNSGRCTAGKPPCNSFRFFCPSKIIRPA